MNTDIIYWLEECKNVIKPAKHVFEASDNLKYVLAEARESGGFSVYISVKKALINWGYGTYVAV